MRLTEKEYKQLTGREPPPPTSTLLHIEPDLDVPRTIEELAQKRREFLENHGSQPKREQKYAAVPTEVDGIRFASKKEARRYEDLRDRQLCGEISGLEWQKTYRLEIGELLLCKYVADFVYQEQGELVVEDCKGWRDTRGAVYRLFLLKKRLMLALHSIEVKEV